MSRQQTALAYAMAAVGVVALYLAHVRPWIYRWGAHPDEVTDPMPGDELVEATAPRTTRAVTIAAAPEEVWPWLVQIGEDRAGFYSYSLLERAVGAHIHNADIVHPEWQQLRVGDTVWLARRYGPNARQIVAALEPESHLVLVSVQDFDRLQRGEKATGYWGFSLHTHGPATRLVARGSGGAVGHIWFDIPHFVMEQKMLRGIAARVRRNHRAPALRQHT